MANEINLSDYTFYAVAKTSDLPEGERLFLEIGDEQIVILNVAGKLYALGDVCSHDGGPLGEGELDGCAIVCPRHGARFDIRTGAVLALPAVQDIPVYPLRVIEDNIEIGIPND